MGNHSWLVERGSIRRIANIFAPVTSWTTGSSDVCLCHQPNPVLPFTISWWTVRAPALSIQSNWARTRTQMNIKNNDKNKSQHLRPIHGKYPILPVQHKTAFVTLPVWLSSWHPIVPVWEVRRTRPWKVKKIFGSSWDLGSLWKALACNCSKWSWQTHLLPQQGLMGWLTIILCLRVLAAASFVYLRLRQIRT